jgi:hypothetical protein
MVTLPDVTADASISDAFRHTLQRQMANFPAFSCAPDWATVARRMVATPVATPYEERLRNLARFVSACTLGLWSFAAGLLIGTFYLF